MQDLTKRFGGLVALKSASFTIEAGSLVALIGPNGAGKSTVFNLVTNFYAKTGGSVRFFGKSLAGQTAQQIAASGLVRTFQTARVFPGMTTLQNVLVGAQLHVRAGGFRQMIWSPHARREERLLVEKAEALLDIVGLTRCRDQAATDLPMGAQKLVEVIRALMAKPRMLLLDEPAAGLNDTETNELATLLNAVRSIGTTVMVVEHNMSFVMNLADKIVVLDAGEIVATGTPAQIRGDARVVESYVGRDVDA